MFLTLYTKLFPKLGLGKSYMSIFAAGMGSYIGLSYWLNSGKCNSITYLLNQYLLYIVAVDFIISLYLYVYNDEQPKQENIDIHSQIESKQALIDKAFRQQMLQQQLIIPNNVVSKEKETTPNEQEKDPVDLNEKSKVTTKKKETHVSQHESDTDSEKSGNNKKRHPKSTEKTSRSLKKESHKKTSQAMEADTSIPLYE